MLTVYILGSSEDKKQVERLWKHLSLARRQVHNVIWASPLYVENVVADSHDLVEAIPGRYIVVSCLSSDFITLLLNEPAIREMVNGAIVKIPLLLRECTWDEAPLPFVGVVPILSTPLSATEQKDKVLAYAATRIRAQVEKQL